MRIPVAFMILTILTMLMGVTVHSCSGDRQEVLNHEIDTGSPETVLEEPFGDPLPSTEMVLEDKEEKTNLVEFPNEEQLRLIGRLSKGILRVARNKGGGRWWKCGSVLSDEEAEKHAMEWAYRTAYLSWEFSDNGSDGGIMIDPWEVAGIAANESGFDVCALGPWPRKWAYQHKTMKRNRRTLSHSFEEIYKTMTHPKGLKRWSTIGIDAAPLHQLWRCDEKTVKERGWIVKEVVCVPKWNVEGLPPIPLKEVFSLGKGFEYNVRKLKKDSIKFKTKRPSLYWPGHRSECYSGKVRRWERRLGAYSSKN